MKKAITTIKITDTDIRLFQSGKAQDKDVITFCDTRPTASCSDEDIIKLLGEMLVFLPVSPDEVIFLVPRQSVIVKQMRLPSHKHDEIDDMTGLQLVNNILYPVEDVVYKYHLLGQDSDGYSRVLAVVIHKEASRRYCRIMQGAGIKDGKLVLDSLGILGWLAYQESAYKADDCQPVVLLNINSQHSEICFCQNKRLFFSRSIPYGEDSLRSGDTSELVRQIKLSLETYQKEHLGPAVKGILILSTADEAKVFGERLGKESRLPAEILDPLNDIFCANSMDRTVLRTCRPASITAELGFLLSGTKSLMNLAPEEIHTAKQARVQRRQWAKSLLLLFMVATLSLSSQFIDIHKKRVYSESLKRETDRLKPQLKEARRKIQFVEFFDRKLKNYSFIPDLIDELNRLTPEEISLRMLALDQQRNLMIQGYARTHSGVNDFQTRLIQSSRFHDVDLRFATKREIANMPVMDFKIVSQLNHNCLN
ncbi:MAG: PilN domain-containing protein [Candidatus Omnitrophica bacterium]|nr:PilN domain-containing protein [Candidatus Omnitrophota bacterium]